MKINAIRIFEADKSIGTRRIEKRYTDHSGLACKEFMYTQRENDYVNESQYRESTDNGKSFGEWQTMSRDNFYLTYGDDELYRSETVRIWNPVHCHYVSTFFTRYFIEGHTKAYEALWKRGEREFFDHQYIAISESGEGDIKSKTLVKYEDGVDFDESNLRNPEFLEKNCGFSNSPIVLKCGDIAVPVGVSIPTACRIAGVRVEDVFPSCPTLHRAVIVARGKYNADTERYDFTFSNPVILSDLQSSRGIDEPILAELESGRIILVMRGSNVQEPIWNTRIAEGAPAYKWFSYSDDGGATFTAPAPWQLTNGEPIYSAATYSKFIRSTKNGKLYWIGNISDENTYGSFPRFPLCICEVDEESGLAKAETLEIIDTRREGETEHVQITNFDLIEDRETGNFEIRLAKPNQFDKEIRYFGETWQYVIEI